MRWVLLSQEDNQALQGKIVTQAPKSSQGWIRAGSSGHSKPKAGLDPCTTPCLLLDLTSLSLLATCQDENIWWERKEGWCWPVGILSLSNKVPRNSIFQSRQSSWTFCLPRTNLSVQVNMFLEKGMQRVSKTKQKLYLEQNYSEALQSKVFCKHSNISFLVKRGAPGLLGTGFSHHSKSQEIRDCSETIGEKKTFLKCWLSLWPHS